MAIGAKLNRCAFILAFTAVIDVGRGIYTNTRTIVEQVRTRANTVHTFFTAGAFDTTGATMCGIAIGIDTRSRTSDLSGGTIEDALAIGTKLA